MIEVFRTNVNSPEDAGSILHAVRAVYPRYVVNFDLQDADKILRVATSADDVDISGIVNIVQQHGYHAEVLLDELYPLPDGYVGG